MIDTLANEMVLSVSCGFWHNCAIVMVAPMRGCGQLWTWGSGHHGQLAQESKKISLIPAVSKTTLDMHLNLISVKSGQFHNAFMTIDKKLYTFGSNSCGCLGRPGVLESFTPIPGLRPPLSRIAY